MLTLRLDGAEAPARLVRVDRLPCRIGRRRDSDVVLAGWRVAREHAELRRIGAGVHVVDLGSLGGTWVNGERVHEFGPLQEGDEVAIGGFRLQVRQAASFSAAGMPRLLADVSAEASSGPRAGALGGVAAVRHAEAAAAAVQAAGPDAGRGPVAGPGGDDFSMRVAGSAEAAEAAIDGGGAGKADAEGARRAGTGSPGTAGTPGAVQVASAARADMGEAAARAVDAAGLPEAHAGAGDNADADADADADAGLTHAPAAAFELRRLVHRLLIETIDLRRTDVRQFTDAQLRADVRAMVEEIVSRRVELPAAGVDRARLVDDVVDEAVGLGPLQRLLTEPDVTEIMVNRPDEIFIERAGRIERCDAAFTDETAVRGVIDRIVAPLGRRIDEASPMVDARLPDGSRVNAIIPPLAVRGPAITIRRFSRHVFTPDELVARGSASADMMRFLQLCIEHRRNLVVSGGTGSGKTSLLNVLSNFIPRHERLLTIEDAAELRLRHAHLVSLEARPANAEGRGAVTIRDLVRNALRMRPDRIIVGECRGPEAIDMLQAMNTGHEGSLTTVHANGARDALARLETMALMADVGIPLAAIREQIASAVDVVVHQARASDGSRRIVRIVEVTGIEGGRIQTADLFGFEQRGVDPAGRTLGAFRPTGLIPAFFDTLRESGFQPDVRPFRREEAA